MKLWQPIFEKVNCIQDDSDKGKFISTLRSVKRPVILSFVNAHAVNLMYDNAQFRTHIFAADHVVRDGFGLALLYKLMGKNPGLNMNGTDFIPELITTFQTMGVALIGAKPENNSEAVNKLSQKGLTIQLAMHGYHPKIETYINALNSTKPKLIVLGFGMPLQESIAQDIKSQLNFPCLIVNGGACIDFISGNAKRAPKWIRLL